ncbi:MAG TPA: phosphatidate cytidylyltransferase, partial [Pyrinomonadaceae bacterium]|nr:phosphatidate cytidylyltransferase [Pyrinomonadaceae bacterium]
MKTQTPEQKPKSKLAGIPPSIARVLTAIVLLPILIVSILIAKLALLFVLIATVAMVIALYEFWLLARRQQVKADVAAGYLGAAALLTVFYFADPRTGLDFEMMQAIILVFTMGALAAAMLRGAPFDKMIMSVGATVLGVLYVVLLGGHLVAVRVGFAAPLSRHLL